jgi:hypothetical protein
MIPRITGALSILGSCSILYDIYMNRERKMKQPYYRILLGMSLFDVLCSTSICMTTLPMPVDTPGVHGARGNTQACTASGFFNQFMLGSILYNLVLAVYYTMSGRFKMSDEEFARRYEPHLHWVTVVVTVGVAIGEFDISTENCNRLQPCIHFNFLRSLPVLLFLACIHIIDLILQLAFH